MSEGKIDRKDVQHVALLSRLHLTEEDLVEQTLILNRILEYFAKLNELDTAGIPCTSHSIEMKNVFREDVAMPSLSIDAALANAPDKEENCFKVPKIIQEG
jgi:aspartyl-tRNA(Asn)/glutamyl-tRNA(Gln) amidotransferase subunit C